MYPYLPTLGNQAYSYDVFLMYSEGHITNETQKSWFLDIDSVRESKNSCFLDIDSCDGLSKVINGGVESYKDILGAEAAIHALVWHDQADIIIPSFLVNNSHYKRAQNPNNNIYQILDNIKSKDSSFISKDALFPVEQIWTDENWNIIKSNIRNTHLIGQKSTVEFEDYLKNSLSQTQGLCYIPKKLQTPTYFTNTTLTNFEAKWERQLYKIINKEWSKKNDMGEVFSSQIIFPPLLSIVLDRANGSHLGAKNREKILDRIIDLRLELINCRKEMEKLNELFSPFSCKSPKEVKAKYEEIQNSFNNIVNTTFYKEKTFLEKVLKYAPKFIPVASIISRPDLITAVISAAQTFFNLLEIPKDQVSPTYWTNKTTTAKTLSKLLNIKDNMSFLSSHFFTEQELENINNHN